MNSSFLDGNKWAPAASLMLAVVVGAIVVNV
jgi:hypothetical protein